MSTIEMEWKDPGPRRRKGRGGGRNLLVLDQLHANPGEWAVVATGKSTGQSTWWKNNGCEVTSRRQDDGMVETFARWPMDDVQPVPAEQAPPARTEPIQPAPAVPAPPPAVELPTPLSPALIGQRMGDCTCGRRDVLLDTDDLCILCRGRHAAQPHGQATP